MSAPSPWLRAANWMSAAGIERVVVGLDVHLDEARGDVEWYPLILARWDYGTGRVRPFPAGLSRLAELAWDAVEAHYKPDDPPRAVVVESLSTSPFGRIREAVSCNCDPWHGTCRLCGDTGWRIDTAAERAS